MVFLRRESIWECFCSMFFSSHHGTYVMLLRYVTICTIWRTWKTPMEECYFQVQVLGFQALLKVTPPCVFFTFFKSNKWYQIAQSVSHKFLLDSLNVQYMNGQRDSGDEICSKSMSAMDTTRRITKNDLVGRVETQGSLAQNHSQTFVFPRSIKWVSWYHIDSVKSKLSPISGTTAKERLNPKLSRTPF